MSKKGIFITFEGNEGSGKSTQIKLLYQYLKRKKLPMYLTREPGGTRVSGRIRELLLDRRNRRMTPLCETFLYMASRAQLVEEVLIPKLKAGNIVLCDRWLDATMAYQGYGGGVHRRCIESLGKIASQNVTPALTIYLDLPVRVGLRRAGRHKAADRVERKPFAFHQRVRRGYLSIAKKEPTRFRRIAIRATDSVPAVHKKIRQLIGKIIHNVNPATR